MQAKANRISVDSIGDWWAAAQFVGEHVGVAELPDRSLGSVDLLGEIV
jgi:hypothetical protein